MTTNNSTIAKTVTNVTLEGITTFVSGFVPSGAAGTVNNTQTPLGGLSGVVYDDINNVYYSLSDARSDSNGLARFYTFTANLTNISTPQVTFTNATPLKTINGNFFSSGSLNPEGFAFTQNGTVFVASEGEVNINAGRVIDPFIKEFNLSTGQEVRSLPIPTNFLPVVVDTNNSGTVNAGDTQTSGVRDNLAFESLTITPNQQTLYTAVENALLQDGALATFNAGSRSRIIQYNLVTGQPEKQYLYVTEPAAEAPAPPTRPFVGNGLVDLLAIDNQGTLLALERSVLSGGTVANTTYTIKLYEVKLQNATDISSLNSLPADISAIQPVQKRLLLTLNSSNSVGNIEGLAFGPTLPNGRQSIVMVVDNNFNTATQILTLSADVNPISVAVNQSNGNASVTEGGATDTYTLVLTSQPTANVTVTINSGSQLTTSATQLVFTPQNWNIAQTVTVTAVNDAIAEGTHTGTIQHTVTSSDSNYNGITIAPLTVDITDNDTAGVTITQSGGSTNITEGGATDTYTVILNTQPTNDVIININPGTQTTTNPTSLTFTAANWNIAQTVTVTAVNDAIAEGTHTGTIQHTATSSDSNYNGITIANVIANITDNNTAGVTITQSGGSTNITEGGATDTYTVVLNTQPTNDVIINLNSGLQLTTNPTILIFTTTNWNIAQTVTVTAIDDAIAEGTHTDTIQHTVTSTDSNYNGIITPLTVNITDNDSATSGATPGNDILRGTPGNDTIDGFNGNDYIFGNAGDDTLYGNNGNDYIFGNAGDDTLYGNDGSDFLYGNEGNDILYGGDGNDNLDGGLGDDTLIGGNGDDIYTVDSPQDTIIETAEGGKDKVNSSINWILGDNLENLALTGNNPINGTGNNLNNQISGNNAVNTLNGGEGNDWLMGKAGNDTLIGGNGNDRLDGGSGNDILIGGAGNDQYEVDSVDDIIIEAIDEGIDTIFSIVELPFLADNVENLTLVGNGNINATGNNLNNRLTGNAGNNTLIGNGGDDFLSGGQGNDLLIGGAGFDTLVGDAGVDIFDLTGSLTAFDTIRDFQAGETVRLSGAEFGLSQIGTLDAGLFRLGTAAQTQSDRFIYNQAKGELFFDPDGTGVNAQIKIAVFSNRAALTAASFLVTNLI
ncbi:esterase-like activity of phytase family protein [Nostoc sp. CENA543]|uniref:esterase-like activity of phytase family protein n=1 Tax=Nostoc sp. CENA543 TaxID=1869241 RepID=UPI0012FFE3F0